MFFSRPARIVMLKMSSSSSGSVASAAVPLVRRLGELASSSGSTMRLSLCWAFLSEKSGTYSKRMLELSRPYHLAGLPQRRRIRYLSSITR